MSLKILIAEEKGGEILTYPGYTAQASFPRQLHLCLTPVGKQQAEVRAPALEVQGCQYEDATFFFLTL